MTSPELYPHVVLVQSHCSLFSPLLPKEGKDLACRWSLRTTLQLFEQNQPLPRLARCGQLLVRIALRSRKFRPRATMDPWGCI